MFEARQERPHRRVALKVMRAGLSSPSLRARFQYEVEVLGALPVEASEADHQPLFLRPPDDVGDLDEGVLDVGGHHFEVLFVQHDEFQRLRIRRIHGIYRSPQRP